MSTLDYVARNQTHKDTILSIDGAVLTITLNRAKEHNTITEDLITNLSEVFQLADRDDTIRVVILTADHKAPAYCSGADISNGWNRLWDPEAEKEGERAHRDGGGVLSLAILKCRKITIAAVNGHAAGVGMTALQLPFDLRFVWEGAKLTFPFVRIGIVPEATSSYLLPKLIGLAQANSLLLTGEVVSPSSPHISGLYHKIVPKREDVYPAAHSLAQHLSANTGQVAVAYAKGLLLHPGDSPEENHLLDSRAMKLLAGGHDGTEGVKAFIEKRKPVFSDTLSKDASPWYPWWKRIDTKHYKTKL